MSRPARVAVTLADVARAAGVSRATASRALNDSPLVTPETRQRVRAAVQETGFVPNALGRALAVGRAQAIAVLVTEPLDELFSDPTYAVLLRGITERLAHTPYLPMLLQASSEFERERAERHFERRSVDAVIDISPYLGGAVLDALTGLRLPVVLCGQLDGDPYRDVFSTVYADDVEGASLAAEAMRTRGRRHVAAILGPQDNPASVDRLRGYQTVLGEMLPDERAMFTGWDSVAGFAAAREMLERDPKIDGILAGSDRIALGVLDALATAGLTVPDDVSVIGFDDHTIAATANPPLTTIRQPLLEEGRAAAETAIAMIDGASPTTTVMHMELVTRASL